MGKWPHDDTASKNAFYGDFQKVNWGNTYLTRIKPPFTMWYDHKPLPTGILVNRMCAEAMMDAFHRIWDMCGHDQEKVDKAGASDYGGCYNVRRIANSDSWSNHSWAAAIDLSPSKNGFRYDNTTTLDHIVIDAFKGVGALWGGDYHVRKDPMHFEFVSR